MSMQLVPESAPFSAEQRAWLNGFLSGVLGALDQKLPSGISSENAMETADDTRDQKPTPSCSSDSVSSYPWHDSSLSMTERMQLAQEQPKELRLMAAMAQLNCGSCGYLCKSYAEAIAKGSEKNLTLCSPGGAATAKMLRQLVKESTAPAREHSDTSPRLSQSRLDRVERQEPGTRSNPAIAELISCERLNGRGSLKDTRHVVIDLADSGLRYQVGDALGIYPTNCIELVDRFLIASRLDPHANAVVNGKRVELKQELQHRCLRSIPMELVETAVQLVKDRPKRNGQVRVDADIVLELQAFAESDQLDELDCVEFMELFPSIPWTPQIAIDCLQPIAPRLYSIASSQARYPHEVHLTVSRVESKIRDRRRKGVASTMLADRLLPGSRVKVFVHKSHGFTIPSNPMAPMIMVGPGTGIAPFISFLQQREADHAGGKNWLFFGDQTRENDFLYREQLSRWVETQLLSRLELAFSRDSTEKVYVQHRMKENGGELFEWLNAGAYFFVCGDARRMALDVENTLLEIISSHGNMTPDQSQSYLRELKESGRYVRDVY